MPDEEKDYYQIVNDTEKDFADLFNRMDEDKKLAILEEYVMRNEDNREEPDVDEITMNDPGTFRDRVVSTLIKAMVKPEVEGKNIQDDEAEIVENFIRDINNEADNIAMAQDCPDFKTWDMGMACDRGRVARRITLDVEDGKLASTSFTQVDPRYLIYDVGVKGLKWVATKIPMSKDDIEEEFGAATKTGSSAIVTECWDAEKHIIYIGRDEHLKEANAYGEPPFVIQTMPTGVWTMDSDRMLRSGESIYARNRDLYSFKNMFASILNSGVIKSFFNGLQIEVENAALAKKPAMSPYRKKTVIPIEKGTKGYFSMPIEDLTNTARQFYSILDSALQEGGLPKVSYGNIQFPLSAVGMAELKEAEDPLYFPRLQGLAFFWQRCLRMTIKQYCQFANGIEIGEEGFGQSYQSEDLKKSYSIKFNITLKSPKMDMVNISTAAAVGDLISEDTKLREYLHVDNPTLEVRKKLVEKAARMSPAVNMYDTIKALYEQGEKIKADIMAEELGVTLDQILGGQLPPIPGQEEKKPTQMMPFFQGTGGTVKPATEGEGA